MILVFKIGLYSLYKFGPPVKFYNCRDMSWFHFQIIEVAKKAVQSHLVQLIRFLGIDHTKDNRVGNVGDLHCSNHIDNGGCLYFLRSEPNDFAVFTDLISFGILAHNSGPLQRKLL